eukprot:6180820-Pleurochrysis_carterae.AAC.2
MAASTTAPRASCTCSAGCAAALSPRRSVASEAASGGTGSLIAAGGTTRCDCVPNGNAHGGWFKVGSCTGFSQARRRCVPAVRNI